MSGTMRAIHRKNAVAAPQSGRPTDSELVAALDVLRRFLATSPVSDAAPSPKRWLVGPKSTSADVPLGHTVRELYDARRAGKLEAELTPAGIVFTDDALRRYEQLRRRRREKLANDTTPASVQRTLERAGIATRKAVG